MPRQTNRLQAPINGETNGTQHANGEGSSAMRSLADKVEQIRETLKTVLRDLGEVTDGLKLAEKEKKVTDKEIEGFRANLRKIQNFSI